MNPLAFFSPYKTLIEVLVIGAIIAGIGFGTHKFLEHEQDIGYQKAKAEYEAKLLAATEAARQREAALNQQLQEAQNAATQRDQTIRTLSAAVGSASNGLRGTLDAISRGVPTASIDALRNTTAVLASIFNECQDRYRSVAEAADRANSDKQTLMQAWPKP